MNSIEVRQTKDPRHPRMFTVSMSSDEYPLPDIARSGLPTDTHALNITVYLGAQNPEAAGTKNIKFGEHVLPTRKPEGPILSYDNYRDVLTGQGVPSPADDLWTPAKTIYVSSLGVVSQVDDLPDNPQLRVTTIRRNQKPEGPDTLTVPDGDAFVDELEGLGLPPGHFDFLRRRWPEENNTDLLRLPGMRPVVRIADAIGHRLTKISYRRIPDNTFVSTVRTHREPRPRTR